jgi:hypothetical protein
VVLGLQEPKLNLVWHPRTVREERFFVDDWSLPNIKGTAQDGYLAARVKARDTIGIVQMNMTSDGRFVLQSYSVCADKKALVVEIPRSGVFYLVDMVSSKVDGKLQIAFRTDFTAAQQHVDPAYPGLRSKLETLPVRWLPTDRQCAAGVTTIPIFVPIRR